MKLFGDKIFVRFTNESMESIYLGKEITRNDGSKVRLFINVPAKDDDDRKAALTIQTAVVEAVSDEIKDIQVGDIAIVNYDLFNAKEKIVYETSEGITFCINATTTYHTDTLIAYANRQSKRDQIVYQKGDFDEVSFLLGIIRGDKLIARSPFVFIDHASNEVEKETRSGIIYKEKQKTLVRRVLAVSDTTSEKYSTNHSDKILVFDCDIFEIKLFDKSIDCVYDLDIVAKLLDEGATGIDNLQPIGSGR
jgi:hypothetical protein